MQRKVRYNNVLLALSCLLTIVMSVVMSVVMHVSMVWHGMGGMGWDGMMYGMAWMISACLPVCLLAVCLSVCLPVYLPVCLSRTCIICINLLNVTLLLDLGPKKQAPSAILIFSQLEEVAVEGGNCEKGNERRKCFTRIKMTTFPACLTYNTMQGPQG